MTAKRRAQRAARPRPTAAVAAGLPALLPVVQVALDDMKALNVRTLDVRGLTDITDVMVIASGTSDRHVRSIADRVQQQAKAHGIRPYGVEGEREG
ncbi:MAG: ribosome silencing factor, partial [Steroidobacteraceae bacterium]|nr:ribosome silencing factor [Steroidobacteraceae bacterium]